MVIIILNRINITYIPFRPTPLKFQSEANKCVGLAVNTTICCISLQVNLLLASSVKATIPAASGAEADVPV